MDLIQNRAMKYILNIKYILLGDLKEANNIVMDCIVIRSRIYLTYNFPMLIVRLQSLLPLQQ